MSFPEVQRLVFKNNPLINVICQLRYPQILNIETDVPSSFQNLIRDIFPEYHLKQEISEEFTSGISPNNQRDITFSTSSSKIHEFVSIDNNSSVHLTKSSLSISAKIYTEWAIFFNAFKSICDSFCSIYNPAFISRIGLRYINVFDRSKLGCSDTNWGDLLNSSILGLLSSEIQDSIVSCASGYVIKLDNDSGSLCKLSLSTVKHIESGRDCLKLDNDFYCPIKSDFKDVFLKLERLHNQSTRIIPWVAKDKLISAMNPI